MILAVTALFVWLANVEIISRGIATSTATTITGTARNLRSMHALERKRTSAASSSGLNLHYYSKRKVPNGPDPIHNRYYSQFNINVWISFFIVLHA